MILNMIYQPPPLPRFIPANATKDFVKKIEQMEAIELGGFVPLNHLNNLPPLTPAFRKEQPPCS